MTSLDYWLAQHTGRGEWTPYLETISVCVIVACCVLCFVTIWIQARPDRWMVFQFILSVIGGILFILAWNAGPGAHPLGQEGRLVPILAVVAGYWFNKAVMFCIIWARFGGPAARSMRLLD